jgi:hypothetical protein
MNSEQGKGSKLSHNGIHCAVLSKNDHVIWEASACLSSVEITRWVKQLADSTPFLYISKSSMFLYKKAFLVLGSWLDFFLEQLGADSPTEL